MVIGTSFVCSRNQEMGGTCPSPLSVQRSALESYVISEWSARLSNLDIDDPLLTAVAERWTALQRPEETEELREAQQALKSAQAELQRFHSDDRAGFYKGRSAQYRLPAKEAAEKAVEAAEGAVEGLSGGWLDVGWLLEGMAGDYFTRADLATQRDLIGIAIERVVVRKAPAQGARFVGDERVRIEWVSQQEG